MHDGAEIVYLANHNGNCWIQLSADGKIDIYSQSDISMHTESNFNCHIGGNFNIDADTINMKARGSGGTTFECATGEFNLHANKDIKLTTDLNGHIKAKGNVRVTADGLIDLNGPPATAATKTVNNNISVNTTVKQSITDRVPEAEPWGGHNEEQEILSCVASPNRELSALDIDMSDIKNRSTQEQVTSTVKNTDTKVSTKKQSTYGQNPRAYNQADLESVESLHGFNESLGGGVAQAELTEGERAYALEKGYIKSSQTFRSGGPR